MKKSNRLDPSRSGGEYNGEPVLTARKRVVSMLPTADLAYASAVTITASTKKIMALPLTPDQIHRKLQPPRSNVSAFESPRRSPKAHPSPLLSPNELSFFSRVTEASSSNESSFSSTFMHPLVPRSSPPQERSLLYVSPASASASAHSSTASSAVRMAPDVFSYRRQHRSQASPMAMAPVVPTFSASPYTGHQLQPKVAALSDETVAFFSTPQPVHLLEQQQAQVLLQQEQELLQRQKMQNELLLRSRKVHEAGLARTSVLGDTGSCNVELRVDHVEPTGGKRALIEHPLMELLDDQSLMKPSLVPHIKTLQPTAPLHLDQTSSRTAQHAREERQPELILPKVHPSIMTTEKEKCADLRGRIDIEHPLSQQLLSPVEPLPADHEAVEKSSLPHGPYNAEPSIDRCEGNQYLELQTWNPKDEFTDMQSKLYLEPPPALVLSQDPDSSADNSIKCDIPNEQVIPRNSESLASLNNVEPDQTKSLEGSNGWRSEAVEAVSSTMNRALGKIKSLATHMAKTAGEPNEKTRNGATETSSSSNDNDVSFGFDLKELEAELRGKKVDDVVDEKLVDTEVSYFEERKHRRNFDGSMVSVDTLGAPKPAPLAQHVVPPQNLQKPVPLPMSEGRPQTKFTFSNDEILDNQPTKSNVSASRLKARAVTPIMRMRNGEEQQFTALPRNESGSVEDSKNDGIQAMDYRTKKQKQWKLTSQIARRERNAEKLKLEKGHDNIQARRAKNRRSKKSLDTARKVRTKDKDARNRSLRFPLEVPSCRNEVSKFVENLFRTRCGDLNDTYEEDDDSADSMDGSDRDDDEESAIVSASSIGRSRTSIVTNTTKSMTKSPTRQGPHESDFDMNMPSEQMKAGVHSKQFIGEFIRTATTNGFSMMLHKKNRMKALNRPLKSIAFILRGVHGVDGRFTTPKLSWKIVYSGEVEAVDLFDIRSLEKATVIELKNYPLAMPGRCFFVRMNKGPDFVLEARSEDEALRFVHGMRWIIARLSFNLIIGNIGVSCEMLDIDGAENGDDDQRGYIPKTLTEVANWTIAMNDVTSRLIDSASEPFP